MDLHRLRVVEFNTLVSEKEGRKKYVAELEEHKKKYKSNFDDKQYETIESENDSKCLDDKIWPQKAPQKFGDGVNIKYLVDKIGPPGTSKQCLAKDQASRTPTSRLSSFMKHKSKSEIFSITSKCKFISWKITYSSSYFLLREGLFHCYIITHVCTQGVRERQRLNRHQLINKETTF